MSFTRPTQIGEGFAGSGADAAHVNTILGHKNGPVETAWATALASPTQGYVPFVVVQRPNLAVKPPTLFVNKADIRGDRHAALTWGAAQAGVAQGVLAAVADAIVPSAELNELLLIAAVWVDWEAADEEAVYHNNLQATRDALEAGHQGRPSLDELLAVKDEPANPFFRRG